MEQGKGARGFGGHASLSPFTMAILKLGPLVSDIRGSVGGVVFSRSRGGTCCRARVKPTLGQSAAHTDITTTANAMRSAWTNILTQANRDAWNAAASNTIFRDGLGRDYTPSGYHCWMRLIGMRALWPGIGPINPTEPLIITFPPMYLLWHAGTSQVRVTNITNQSPFQSIAFAAYNSPDFPPSITSPKGPWTLSTLNSMLDGTPFSHALPPTTYLFRPCRRFYKLIAYKGNSQRSAPVFLSILIPAP